MRVTKSAVVRLCFHQHIFFIRKSILPVVPNKRSYSEYTLIKKKPHEIEIMQVTKIVQAVKRANKIKTSVIGCHANDD